jgi:hypothetical protein
MKMSIASAVLTGFVAVFAATGSAQVPTSAVALNTSAALSASSLAPAAKVPTFVPLSFSEGPDPGTAWVFAAGFLALVALRRLGSASQL